MSQKSGKRLIKSVIQADDWAALVEKVLSANRKCESLMHLTDIQEERTMLAQRASGQKTSLNVQKQLLLLFEQSQEHQSLEKQDKKERALLQDLATASNYEADKNFVSTRIADTCEWFFEDQTFKQWRDCPESSLLWVTAGPGCGKSVLARALIDERRVSRSVMSSTVCYFFFKDSQERRTQSGHALGSLLHQLFQASDLIKHGLASHRSHGKGLLEAFPKMWDILLKAANDPDAGEIVCVIDALDECEQNSRLQLLDRIITFYSRPDLKTSPTVLKFLITSRPYEDLDDRFQHLRNVTNYIRCDGDEHSQQIAREINIVIDAKITEILPKHSQSDQTLIANRMKSQNNRTYLWLFLTIDIIKSSGSKYRKLSSIQGLMDDLPIQIADAYEKILSRSSDEIVARRLLQIIVAAQRPLSLEEANIALTLATQPECQSLDELELWPSETFAADIKNFCGLLVTCFDNKIALIHQTAREFLLRPVGPAKADQKSWRGSIGSTEADELMAEICTRYLLALDPLQLRACYDGPVTFEEEEGEEEAIRGELEARLPLLQYSASAWALHYRNQTHFMGKSHNPSFQRALTLCDAEGGYCNWWLLYREWGRFRRNARSSLLLAVHQGLDDLINAYLGQNLDKDLWLNYHEPKYPYYYLVFRGVWAPPLHLALTQGRMSTVKTLIDFGADVNLYSNGVRPLHVASANGYEDLVELLLNHGAEIEARTFVPNGSSHQDGKNKHGETTNGMTEDGEIEDDIKDYEMEDYDTEDGETEDDETEDGETEDGEIVDEIEDFEMKDYETEDGETEDDEFVDCDILGGATALEIAISSSSHFQVCDILLKHGANVNARFYGGNSGWTPLIEAVGRRSIQITKLLLDNKADTELTGGELSHTPLQEAVAHFDVGITHLLLQSGADVNARSANCVSAFHLATQSGQKNILELLLDAGADINAGAHFDAGGDFTVTPLLIAVLEDHPKTVKFLLDHGADPNISMGPFGTPLEVAKRQGFPDVVDILMMNGGTTRNDDERELFAPFVKLGRPRITLERDGQDLFERE